MGAYLMFIEKYKFMKEVEITLVVMGDVKNPHTWSGTPYNIYRELIKKGVRVNCINENELISPP